MTLKDMLGAVAPVLLAIALTATPAIAQQEWWNLDNDVSYYDDAWWNNAWESTNYYEAPWFDAAWWGATREPIAWPGVEPGYEFDLGPGYYDWSNTDDVGGLKDIRTESF